MLPLLDQGGSQRNHQTHLPERDRSAQFSDVPVRLEEVECSSDPESCGCDRGRDLRPPPDRPEGCNGHRRQQG